MLKIEIGSKTICWECENPVIAREDNYFEYLNLTDCGYLCDKCMGATYVAIGKKNKLTGTMLIRYVNYMTHRWGKEEEVNCKTGYASEWAERFKGKYEYNASDLGGQQVLDMIDKELGLESRHD